MLKYVLVLHNVRSVHNVGSIFRTADAAGVDNIILSGYTPAPLDRFGRARKDFAKVSLGAEKTIKWQSIKNTYAAIKGLKLEGYTVVAIEQDKDSISLFKYKKPVGNIALVLGNEVRGLSKAILGKCDVIAEIPMHGSKESLNVAVAAGIALFTLAHA